MKKCCRALDKSIQELNGYLYVFSTLPPRGDGAKEEAIKEFKEMINNVIVNLKNVEKRQIELIESDEND